MALAGAVEDIDLTTVQREQPGWVGGAQVWWAVAIGVGMTLCVRGYQFGRSNHTVYLLDALRWVRPELLARDWWATQTLQYHTLFGIISQYLLRWG